MHSYNAENGRPSCANSYILNDVLRERFNQPHALVTTDCGAVNNMRGAPTNTPTDALAAAYTINNGTDIEMGSTVWTDHLMEAVQQGHVTEATVKQSARRAFRQLMMAGRFDPASMIGWSSLGVENINSSYAQLTKREAALMGMVLLKNQNDLLPLKAGSKLAVVGPMAVTTDLMSDYAGGTGEAGCWPNSDESCIVSIGQAVATANSGGTTTIHKGVDVNSKDASGIPAAISAAREADIVVLVIGNDRTQEHEGHDRPDTALPGLQADLAKQITALKKPLLLLMSNGGALAIDNLVAPSDAIVECFNPAQNTPELAELLFGNQNRWGKLPVTMYPHDYTSQQPMVNYDMSRSPGRTYKYYTGKPLFEYGTGLSLTTFSLACSKAGASPFTIDCLVKNTGKRDGDEVVMIFHSASSDIRAKVSHPVPIKSLIDFERVSVATGSNVSIRFELSLAAAKLVNAQGDRVLYPGARRFVLSTGAGPVQEVPFSCDASGSCV